MPESGNYGTPTNPQEIWSSYWQLQWYTGSHPAHVEGDFWGRSDLDTGDKIATAFFDNGSTLGDIPIYPTSIDPSGESVKDVVRVETPNGRGWMPVFEGGGAYNYLAHIHGGNRHGFHDDKVTDGRTELYFEDNHVERPWQVTGDYNGIYVPSRDETYVCWHAKTEAWVTRYDHASGEWADNQFVGSGGVDDYHGAPSMFVDSDGYIHVAWGRHGASGEMLHGISDTTYDITSWTVHSNQPFNQTNTTYPMWFESGDGNTLFFACREGAPETRSFSYWKTTDNGSTWSSKTDLIEFTDYWMYNPAYFDAGSEKHLLFREYDDVNVDSNKYYHAIFDTADESLRSIDGTSLSIPLGRSEAISNCEIADVSELPNVDFFDSRMRIDTDQNGNPYIVCHGYSGSGGNPSQYYNMFVYHDGSSWSSPEEVTPVAGFHAMPSIRVNTDTDVDMFTVLDDPNATGTKIVRFNWNGSSWSEVEDILTDEYPYYGASVNVKDYNSEFHTLLSEYDGSDAGTNDRTTRLKSFAYGDSGIVTRVWSEIPTTGDYQWYIDEGGGTTLDPDVGAVSATINGATWGSESGAVGGNYLSFDGTNDYAQTDQSIDAAQNTFTVFGWARVNTFSGFDHTLVGAGQVGLETDPGWYIFTDEQPAGLGVVLGQSSSARNVSFPSSGWGFFGCIVDGNSSRLITWDNSQELDDVSDGTGQRTPGTGDPLEFGRSGNSDSYFDGDLDFVGFAETQLSKSDLTELWEATRR